MNGTYNTIYQTTTGVYTVTLSSNTAPEFETDNETFTLSVSSDLEIPRAKIEKIISNAAREIAIETERNFVRLNLDAVLNQFDKLADDIGQWETLPKLLEFWENQTAYKTDNLGRVENYTKRIILIKLRERFDSFIDRLFSFYDLYNSDDEKDELNKSIYRDA